MIKPERAFFNNLSQLPNHLTNCSSEAGSSRPTNNLNDSSAKGTRQRLAQAQRSAALSHT